MRLTCWLNLHNFAVACFWGSCRKNEKMEGKNKIHQETRMVSGWRENISWFPQGIFGDSLHQNSLGSFEHFPPRIVRFFYILIWCRRICRLVAVGWRTNQRKIRTNLNIPSSLSGLNIEVPDCDKYEFEVELRGFLYEIIDLQKQ